MRVRVVISEKIIFIFKNYQKSDERSEKRKRRARTCIHGGDLRGVPLGHITVECRSTIKRCKHQKPKNEQHERKTKEEPHKNDERRKMNESES